MRDTRLAGRAPRAPSAPLVVGLSVACSAAAGAMLGYLLAEAKMLGQVEVHPPNALPPAPRIVGWLAVGLVKGGVVLFFRRMARRRAHHGVL